MAVFLHFAPAVALAVAAGPRALPARAMLVGALCAIVPDADFLLVHAGIGAYGSPWGHRGFTHSLGFALILAFLAMAWPRVVLGRAGRVDAAGAAATPRQRLFVGLYVFACTASHPLLDNLLDVGICPAWLWPLDTARMCIPWRPVSLQGFGMFSLEWFWTEVRYVGLPLLVMSGMGVLFRTLLERRVTKNGSLSSPEKDHVESHGALVDGIVARMRLHGVEAGDSDLLGLADRPSPNSLDAWAKRETARALRARRQQAMQSMAATLWRAPGSGSAVRPG